MEEIYYRKVSRSSISTIENLCAALNITETELATALALPEDEKYLEVTIDKADGTKRKAYKPHFLIRRIQRRINKRLFSPQKNLPTVIIWPDYIFGSIPNQKFDEHEITKDYISCARLHCKSKSLLKIDIRNFFDNIHQDLVEQIFSKFFKFDIKVSQKIAEICCFENRVPQGALTSSYLASLVLHDVEPYVVKRLRKKGLVYTRLVDDITVSSKSHDYDFAYAEKIITDMLYSKDLPINENKTRVERESSTPLTVHGLRVCFKEPRLPAHEVKRLRAAVKNLEIVAKERHYRTTHAYRKDFNRCQGRVNKLARVGHNQHARLISRLKAIQPLPSKKDIRRCILMVHNLDKDFDTKSSQYWYWRRYQKAHERLNILQRTFDDTANILRARLRLIKPTYEK